MGRGARQPRKTRFEASNPLEYIRRLIRSDDYWFSDHVRDEWANGEYSMGDIETSVLGGSIHKTQKDEKGQAVDGKKYVITGRDSAGMGFETVGKIIEGEDGRKYFFITAYGRT